MPQETSTEPYLLFASCPHLRATTHLILPPESTITVRTGSGCLFECDPHRSKTKPATIRQPPQRGGFRRPSLVRKQRAGPQPMALIPGHSRFPDGGRCAKMEPRLGDRWHPNRVQNLSTIPRPLPFGAVRGKSRKGSWSKRNADLCLRVVQGSAVMRTYGARI